MLDAIKGFIGVNLFLLLALIIILPPVGVIVLGLLFVPVIILTGFAWLIAAIRWVFTKGTS